jgi:hypothetical protein
MTKTDDVTSDKGSAWAHELYEMFAPVRKDLEDMSSEEIDAMIDKAVDEVRAITSQPYDTWPADMRAQYEAIGRRLLKNTKPTDMSE